MALISMRGVHKRWDGRAVLEGVDLDVERGQHALIYGPSGSGKSTLLYLLGRLLAPDAGELFFEGAPYPQTGAARAFRLRHIGLLFQDFHLIESLTVAQNVELLALARATSPPVDPLSLLQPLGLEALLDARVNALSRGERQRVALARAFANSPTVVLADEPTASLDPSNRGQTLDHLFALCQRMDTTCVAVAHDPALAERPEFSSCWRLEGGVLVPL